MSKAAQRYQRSAQKSLKHKQKRPSHDEMVRRARQRIIGAVHKRGNGFIEATNLNDAVYTLKKWVRSEDGQLGRGEQVFKVLKRAFRELFSIEVFRRVYGGYRLNPPIGASS